MDGRNIIVGSERFQWLVVLQGCAYASEGFDDLVFILMASPDRVHAGGPSCAYEDTFDSGSERKSEDAEAQAMLGGPQRSTTIQHSNHERFRAGARSVLSWLLWALIAVVVVFAVIMTLPRESSQPRPGDDIYGALPQCEWSASSMYDGM